jgi:MFS family permease
MVVGINSLILLLLVHHLKTHAIGGLGTALVFFAASGLGAFLATVVTPPAIRRWGRYATANATLVAAAIVQVAAATLFLPVMVVCSFFLGIAGAVLKLCADSATQIDVDDALRGHVFAVQDALFWVAYIISITIAAMLIPDDGHAPMFVLIGSVIYVVGLLAHSILGRAGQQATDR